jgi:hypothetical protein
MRAAYEREQRLLDSGLELAGGIDADRVSAIVARAAARTPGVRGALVALADARPVEVGAPAPHRVAIPIEARGSALGRLEVRAGHALAPEEHAALELLALQAGLAVDNHSLLVRERERAGIEAELRPLRDELTEQRCGLGQLLDSQEEERQRVAYRLHDEIEASSSSGACPLGPAHSAPSSRARSWASASPSRVKANTRRPWWTATWQRMWAEAPNPNSPRRSASPHIRSAR